MSEFTRRDFIARAGAAMGSVAAPGALFGGTAEALPPARRRFFKNLSLGRLGFGGTFQQSVDLAQRYGFEGIDPDEKLFASLSDSEMQRLLDGLRAKNLKLASGAFPVNFRRDEVTFNDGLKRLPEVAKTLRRARVDRMNTYVLPCSNSLTYLQNFRQHACRLRECAKVLADYGQRLGLEYVATRTLWRSESQPFIHTMSEMKELEVAIGMDNLGIQLDSWHWYNAQENAADIETLRGRDVITVDLNDAPRLPLDELRDDHRELPAATGVIPVRAFLLALVAIGYDGPVQAEPFNAQLRAMPLDQAVAATAAAFHKAFQEAGLA